MSIWTIILAAGGSKRFGSPKALAPWDGSTLLAHAIATVKNFCGEQFVIVTGSYAKEVSAAATGLAIYNSIWEKGMGTSIAAGMRAILERDAQAEYVIVLPVDMPFVTTTHLCALYETAIENSCCVLTADSGECGPPAVIPRSMFQHLLVLSDDKGLKSCLPPQDFLTVSASGVLRDIDYPQDLQRFAKS